MGEILTDVVDIKKEAVGYFQAILQTQLAGIEEVEVAQIAELVDQHCSDSEAFSLLAPFEAEEIRQALLSLPADKAPGLDGYTLEFYKKSWEIIGNDVVVVVQPFFLYGFLPQSINATILSLVPKHTNKETMSDYRLIACCNLMYKIISKAFANKLKRTLHVAIKPNQCAFVEGSLLLENVLLATELVKEYHKSMISFRCAIKLDISKTFDTVHWSFIVQLREP